MWDYYKDKTLKNLCLVHEFDFTKVSAFFSKHHSETFFTPKECKDRWNYLYNLEKTENQPFSEKSPLNQILRQISKSQGELTPDPKPQTPIPPCNSLNDVEYTDYLKQKELKEKEFFNSVSKQKGANIDSDSLIM